MSQPGDRVADGPDRGRTAASPAHAAAAGRPAARRDAAGRSSAAGRPAPGSPAEQLAWPSAPTPGPSADPSAWTSPPTPGPSADPSAWPFAPTADPFPGPTSPPMSDAVRRTDLWRARQSMLGQAGGGPSRFATDVARAVADDVRTAAANAHATPADTRALAGTVPASPGDARNAGNAVASPAETYAAAGDASAGVVRAHGGEAARAPDGDLRAAAAERCAVAGTARPIVEDVADPVLSPAPAATPGGARPAGGGGAPWTAAPASRPDPADRPTDPYVLGRPPGVDLSALRDTVFGDLLRRTGPDPAESLTLPDAPAAVCDRDDRIVRANDALQRLVGADVELFGLRLQEVVAGQEAGAHVTRADGVSTAVRVVRWSPAGRALSVVVLVELCPAGETEADRAWTVELERLARVGTWSYELCSGRLQRSETLEELYGTVGLDVDDARAPERRQVAELMDAMRSGGVPPGRHVELRLPGDVVLSCRAEVEYAADGSPARLVGVVRDLSAQRPAGRRFLDLMALLPDGVAVLDAVGRVVAANASLAALLDVPLERLRGISGAALAAPAPGEWPDGDAWPHWLRPVPPGAQYGYRVEGVPLRRGDGTSVWCDLAVATTLADDGSRVWIVTATDATDRRRVAEVLRSAGTVDELTRLPNRAASLELVDRLLAGPGRDRVAVVCGDLDDFQKVNCSLGHEAGDDLLVSLAGRLQRELPVGCTAARLAGDEFVVICADHTDLGGPDQLARLVAELLRTTVTVCGRPVPVTASVGLATPAPAGDVRAADLLRFAEVAMHDVKRRHCPGGIAVATDGVVSTATKALQLEAELRAAVSGDGLELAYQPVVGPDGRVLSLEALVRWPHPDRGTIPPAEFLPVAQRCGLLRDLDLWVLREAAAAAATWPEHEGVRPAVAVNLAGLLPGDTGFEQAVTDAVTAAGLAWDRLVLELVETSLVALPPQALAAMRRLTEQGVRFAVDDFGTGYSSLARLKELPAQTVKVDRAFVAGIADDPVDFAVARAVVEMAGAMGRTTVAEGVETAEQFHVLRGIGVDAYQGWLFSRPLAAGAVAGLLAGGRLGTPATAGR